MIDFSDQICEKLVSGRECKNTFLPGEVLAMQAMHSSLRTNLSAWSDLGLSQVMHSCPISNRELNTVDGSCIKLIFVMAFP